MRKNNFPFLFGREAADSILKLEKLISHKSIEYYEQVISIRSIVKLVKKDLKKLLYYHIKEENNKDVQNKLLNLKRDIHNDRNVNVKHLKAYFSEELTYKFERYFHFLGEEKKVISKGRILFMKEREEVSEALFEYSKKEYLLKGLSFSSPTLLNRLQFRKRLKYRDYNKKAHQTELGLTQYVSRCLTKTSPFSTFNAITCYKKDATDYTPYSPLRKGSVQINATILYYVKQILSNCKLTRNCIEIKLNSNLVKKEGNYHYLQNKKNNEYFKKITATEFLSFLITDISRTRGGLSDIVNRGIKVVDTDKKTLTIYLLSLINEGILEWDIPVYASDISWPTKLISYIRDLKSSSITIELIDIIDRLNNRRKKIALSNSFERLRLIKENYELWNDFFSRNNKDSKSVISEKNLYYEDYAHTPSNILPIEFINKIKSELNGFSNSFSKEEARKLNTLEVTEYFKFKYIKEDAIPVLQFYKDYYSEYKKELLLMEENGTRVFTSPFFGAFSKSNSLKKTELLRKNITRILQDGNNTFAFDKAHIKEKKITRKNSALSIYFQIVKKGEQPLIVINDIKNSMAMTASRFLHMYPKEVTEKLKTLIIDLFPDGMNASITDASAFNVNIFPNLTPYYIKTPNNQNSGIESKEILLNDLFFKVENNMLCIINEEKKLVNTFNFSLENIQYKSELFQLLNSLSPAIIFNQKDIINEAVNQIYLQRQKESDIMVLPRIYYGTHIVMQRKTWLVNKIDLPKITKDEWEYFINVNEFIKKHSIPSEVFVTISKQSLKPKDDSHKPQYINFKSPVFVKLFMKLTLKIDKRLKIVEMLPNSEHIKDLGEDKVREYTI